MPCRTEAECLNLDAVAAVAADNLNAADVALQAAQAAQENAYWAWYSAVYEAMLCWEEYFNCNSGQPFQAGSPASSISFRQPVPESVEQAAKKLAAAESRSPMIAEAVRLLVVKRKS